MSGVIVWGGVGEAFLPTACIPHKKSEHFFSKCFISLVIGMEQAQTLETQERGLNVWKETSRPLQCMLLNAPSVKQEVVNSPVKQSTHVGSSDILPHLVFDHLWHGDEGLLYFTLQPTLWTSSNCNAFYVHQGCRGVLRSITAETHQVYDRLKTWLY